VLRSSIETVSFKQGDHVVYRPHGIARIVGLEMKGSAPAQYECYALELPSGARAFIPVQKAASTFRHVSSRLEAESDLEILRSEGVEPDTRFHKARQEEIDRVIRTGTRSEIATHLRKLYAKKSLATESEQRAIRVLEDLVLAEIGLVLGLRRAELENEMRSRYPVLRASKG
jgi:RNA polymerase-interacting CarD/CdnL/TRCF family regulator